MEPIKVEQLLIWFDCNYNFIFVMVVCQMQAQLKYDMPTEKIGQGAKGSTATLNCDCNYSLNFCNDCLLM